MSPPAAFDLLAVIPALSSDNVPATTSALGTLLNTPFSQFPSGHEGAAVPLASGLTAAMHSHEAAVRSLAYRTVARLADLSTALQTALGSRTCSKAILAPLVEYYDRLDEIKAAIVKHTAWATETAASGTLKSAKSAKTQQVDPEPQIPGPEKEVLEACCRALATLVSCSPYAAARICVSTRGQVLATLLDHSSLRVQYRALRLIKVIARNESSRNSLVEAGLVATALNLLSSSPSGAIRLESAQVLSRLCAHVGPANVLLQRDEGVLKVLTVVLWPSTGVVYVPDPTPPPTTTPPGKMDKAALAAAALLPVGPPPLDFERPVRCTSEALQASAMDLLLAMVTPGTAATIQLARMGGIVLLLGVLPPTPPPPAEAPERAPVQLRDTMFAKILEDNQGPREAVTEMLAEDWDVHLMESSLPVPNSPVPMTMVPGVLTVLATLFALPQIQEALWRARQRLRVVWTLSCMLCPTPSPSVGAPPPVEDQKVGRGKRDNVQAPKPEPNKQAFPATVTAAALGALAPLTAHKMLEKQVMDAHQLYTMVQALDKLDPCITGPLATLLLRVFPDLPEEEVPKTLEGATPVLAVPTAIKVLQHLSVVALKTKDSMVNHAVSRAGLLIKDAELVASPRPPLPSPPATPPPPPLATAMYIWDALGRPTMTDGITLPCIP